MLIVQRNRTFEGNTYEYCTTLYYWDFLEAPVIIINAYNLQETDLTIKQLKCFCSDAVMLNDANNAYNTNNGH